MKIGIKSIIAVVLISLFWLALPGQSLMAQTKYILPLGNSLTWGKAHKTDPIPGEHGYRDHLYTSLIGDGLDIEFTGNLGTNPYWGEFHDGARIEQYIPTSVFPSYLPELYNPYPTNNYDISVTLDGLANKPDIVLLHIGTNDINSAQPVVSEAQVSIYEELEILVNYLLDYDRGGSNEIEQIFLCKIIPMAPFDKLIGANAKILDYNSKIEIYYNNLSNADKARVTLVNMHAPFYSNQNEYYGPDDGQVLKDFHDNIHLNETGYTKMAEVWAEYLKNYLSEELVEDFAFTGTVDSRSDWNAISTVRANGNSIYCTSENDGDWDNLAIWDETRGKNAITYRYHPQTSAATDTIHRVGFLFGMDTTIVDKANDAAANGYMLFINGNQIRLHEVVSGAVDFNQITSQSFPYPSPGDVIEINYAISATQTTITVTMGENSAKFVRRDLNLNTSRGYYSGLTFRGYGGASSQRMQMDYVKAKAQFEDFTQPGTIFDLSPISKTNSTITLEWTPVGDNGLEGQAASYDMRYATFPLNAANFENANIIANVPIPSAYDPNTKDRVTVKGLLPGTAYYFAIRALDAWGNSGTLSDPAYEVTESFGEILDDFERQNDLLGSEWSYDPEEYKVDPAQDVLYNAKSGGWGTMALYKGRSNPTVVKMVWGDDVTAPTSGLANGGLILLADDTSSATANGYLLFVRNQYDVIYLFEIENGDIADPNNAISAVPLDVDGLGGYPGAGDTLSVVVDWSEETYNRFDVFINRKPASRFALFDNDKLYGTADQNYAGVMLTQMFSVAGRNNEVEAFITSGDKSSAAGIEVATTPAAQDTVNTTLSDSLRVRVRSEDNVLMPDAPVFFTVTEGGGTISVDQPPADRIYIESEWWTDMKAPMIELGDSETGMKWILSTTSGADDPGYAEYRFFVENAGTYYFWGRTKWSGSYFERDLRFEIDEQPLVGGFTWYVQQSVGSTGDWAWDKINKDGVRYSIPLSRGLHTIKIYTQHKNVPLDKLLLTTDDNPFLSISDDEPTGAVYTNSEGLNVPGVAWTLGTQADDPNTPGVNEGLNRIVARPFGSSQSVTFETIAVPDLPDSLIGSNLSQTGVAGQAAPQLLTVSLKDQYNNLVPDVPVTFRVMDTPDGMLNNENGTLVPTTEVTINTNPYGLAKARLTLGYQSPEYRVEATVEGIDDTSRFVVTVTSGLISDLIPQGSLPSSPARHFVNQPLNEILQVKVVDDQNPPQPIAGTRIAFEVVEGNAVTDSVSYTTDSQGIARGSLIMGPHAERVRVVAKTDIVTRTVLIDTAFYKGAVIRTISGSDQAPELNKEAAHPVVVHVQQASGTNAERQPVTFTAEGHGFTFRGGSQVVVDTTDSDGRARAYVVAGPYQGFFENVIHASATDGFYAIQNSPVEFDFFVRSTADRLEKVEGDSLVGLVGSLVGPLKVRMVSSTGEPVTGQCVFFKRTDNGDGHFGELNPTSMLCDTTDENGYASVWYYLGSQAGTVENPYNNEVTAYFYNARNYRSAVFKLMGQATSADTLSAVSNQELEGVVGKPLTVQAAVEDRAGNKIPNVPVVFKVKAGGGVFNGGGEDSLVVLSNGVGVASIDWYLGTQSGTLNNAMEVSSSNGPQNIKGSPLMFYASGRPDTVDAFESEIWATGPIFATGRDTSYITITLYDSYRNPIPGKNVVIDVQDDDEVHPFGPIEPTDLFGRTQAGFVTYSAGLKEVTARVPADNIALDTTATVRVYNTEAAYIMKNPDGAGDEQVGNVRTVLQEPLIVKIEDENNNAVASVPFTFQVTAGNGSLVEAEQPVVTDSSGLARCHLILGPNTGENLVRVEAEGLTGSPLYFSATAQVNQPTSITSFSQITYQAEAGETLDNPMVVEVRDSQGKPVFGVPVQYTVTGAGSVSNAQTLTNEYGHAEATFTAGTVSGTIASVEARNSSLAGSPVVFQVSVVNGPARNIVEVLGNNQTGFKNENLQIMVAATDGYNNAVSGVSIIFEVVSGDATINNGSSITEVTNSLGRASAFVKLGQTIDPVVVEARGTRPLKGAPLRFTLYPQPDPASAMTKYLGDNQKGTLGQFLAQPLMVKVMDDDGSPVPNVAVRFNKETGGGMIIENQPVYTNQYGLAQVNFRVGTNVGDAEIKAFSVGEVTFNVQAVENPHMPVLNKDEIPSVYPGVGDTPVRAGSGFPVIFGMIAGDDDPSDVLTFEGFSQGYRPLPEGATVTQYSATTAGFSWAPDFDQVGTWPILLRVTDGKGGVDSKEVSITVIKGNDRAPVVAGTLPTVRDTTVMAGETVSFMVDAFDPDNDNLYYSWKVDNITRSGEDESVFFWDAAPTGKRIIDVFISDGSLTSSYRWEVMVSPTSSIDLANFIAQFDPLKKRVRIEWKTNKETQNSGFHIYRSNREEGEYARINDVMIQSQGQGVYEFIDETAQVGRTYFYKLMDVNEQGQEYGHGPVMIEVPIPETFALMQNYPNPFNPTTTLQYQVPQRARVRLTVYNIMGQKIRLLVDEEQAPGFYQIEWDGMDEYGAQTASGIYIYRLQSPDQTVTKRMIKMK